MPRSSDYPGLHPEPPVDLFSHSLPILTDQRTWFRLHRVDHEPIYFGRTGLNRFDDPDGEFGVLYLGDCPHCCFIETHGRSDRGEHRIVTYQELVGRNLTEVTFTRSLRVVDLAGVGLARIGADNRLGTGDYFIAQQWSRALWAHPDQPDGLLYRSRHDPLRTCLALFECAADFVTARNIGSLVDSENLPLLGEILNDYWIGYLE